MPFTFYTISALVVEEQVEQPTLSLVQDHQPCRVELVTASPQKTNQQECLVNVLRELGRFSDRGNTFDRLIERANGGTEGKTLGVCDQSETCTSEIVGEQQMAHLGYYLWEFP